VKERCGNHSLVLSSVNSRKARNSFSLKGELERFPYENNRLPFEKKFIDSLTVLWIH